VKPLARPLRIGISVLTYRLTVCLTIDEFRIACLDLLHKGQEFEVWSYPKGGAVIAYYQGASSAAVSIIRMRGEKKYGAMSTTRCHKVMSSKHLWELTTDDGARFLYFQDGVRCLVVVVASDKVKEKKFQIEIERAEQLRNQYLKLKEGKVK
jgi:hypothetical protein